MSNVPWKLSEYASTNKQHPYAIRVAGDRPPEAEVPSALKGYGSEKSFRKYFGKKVTKLIYFSKVPSFHHPGYRCKALKKASIYGRFSRSHSLRHIKALMLSETRPSNNPKFGLSCFLFKISDYKYLKSLSIQSIFEALHFKPLRKLRSLESLSLTITEQQFLGNYDVFLAITWLKRFKFDVSTVLLYPFIRDLNVSTTFSNFLEKITTINQLEYLEMNLSGTFHNLEMSSRVKFLECLSRINIPSFNIQLSESIDIPFNAEALQASLNNIDLLALEMTNVISVSIACGTDENINKQPMKNAKRKLSFKLIKTGQLGLISSLRLFGASGGLGQNQSTLTQDSEDVEVSCQDPITNLQTLFKDCLSITFPFSQSTKIQHLKSIFVDFTKINTPKCPKAEKLFVRIIEYTTNLEQLEIKRDNAYYNPTNYDSFEYFKLVAHTPVIMNLSSLELQDIKLKSDFMAILSQILELKNLRRLWFNFRDEKSIFHKSELKASLNIPKDSKIRELMIRPPELHEKAVKELIKLIISLPELEEITLPYGVWLTKEANYCLSLLNGLKKLKKLRVVSVLNWDSTNPSTKSAEEDQIALSIRNTIKELFEKNLGMQNLDIDLPFEKIRYTRYK